MGGVGLFSGRLGACSLQLRMLSRQEGRTGKARSGRSGVAIAGRRDGAGGRLSRFGAGGGLLKRRIEME